MCARGATHRHHRSCLAAGMRAKRICEVFRVCVQMCVVGSVGSGEWCTTSQSGRREVVLACGRFEMLLVDGGVQVALPQKVFHTASRS